jgi:hypothetical protein
MKHRSPKKSRQDDARKNLRPNCQNTVQTSGPSTPMPFLLSATLREIKSPQKKLTQSRREENDLATPRRIPGVDRELP